MSLVQDQLPKKEHVWIRLYQASLGQLIETPRLQETLHRKLGSIYYLFWHYQNLKVASDKQNEVN